MKALALGLAVTNSGKLVSVGVADVSAVEVGAVAQAGFAFVGAAVGKGCGVEGVDSGAGGRCEGGHRAVADCCRIAVVGVVDPEERVCCAGGAIADLGLVSAQEMHADGRHHRVVKAAGAGGGIAAKGGIKQHPSPPSPLTNLCPTNPSPRIFP